MNHEIHVAIFKKGSKNVVVGTNLICKCEEYSINDIVNGVLFDLNKHQKIDTNKANKNKNIKMSH